MYLGMSYLRHRKGDNASRQAFLNEEWSIRVTLLSIWTPLPYAMFAVILQNINKMYFKAR
jgi:hypothetical protein